MIKERVKNQKEGECKKKKKKSKHHFRNSK